MTFVIETVKSRSQNAEQEQKIQSTVENGIGAAAMYSDKITRFTTEASEVISKYGARIRFAALFPPYAAFAILALIGIVPLLLVWYFGGE